MTRTTEPLSIRAGDSVGWTKTVAEYPATDGWALAYRILPASGQPVSISTVASGADYTVGPLNSDGTASLPVGRAQLVGYVSRGTDRATIYSAPIEILPNLAAAGSFDGRSEAKIALDQLRAIFAAASADASALTQEYQIAGRMRRFKSIAEIIMAIQYWESQVARETAAESMIYGGSANGRIQVRL